MINVCDAIMGNGKSQSAITYMNEHSTDKFIYITPYLEEANRIKRGCPKLKFAEPSDKLEQYGFKKYLHTAALIKEGRNITTTHQAFKRYTQDMLEDINRNGYTLIVDESVEILEECHVSQLDIQMLVDSGYIKEVNGIYSATNKRYNGAAFRELFIILQSRDLIRGMNMQSNVLFYWLLSPDLFLAFKDVFVLTYLFEAQSIHHLFEIYGIPYRYIGIERINDGTGFRFTENLPGYIPEYVNHIGDMIHIIEDEKMNEIGSKKFDLSMNWFSKQENTDSLKRKLYNIIRHTWGNVPAEKKLWGTYTDEQFKMRGKGYTKAFLRFNARATNEYRDRDHLVYLANVFMNREEQLFYQSHGIEVDNDSYALSIMIQWIWRSAIRDGRPIELYIPSNRMRNLLKKWIDEVSKGGAEKSE